MTAPLPDPEALVVALTLAPATWSRNRFFELYREPSVRRARRAEWFLRISGSLGQRTRSSSATTRGAAGRGGAKRGPRRGGPGDSEGVASRVGAVEVDVEVSAEVMPGVVCLPHGFGHDREGAALRVASARPGVSANDLTDDAVVDRVSGVAVLTGVPVTVAAV